MVALDVNLPTQNNATSATKVFYCNPTTLAKVPAQMAIEKTLEELNVRKRRKTL
jgi:hypothetical protein